MVYRKDWSQPQVGGQGFARTMKTIGRRVNVSATDDVTGNTVGAFTIPAGFVVTSILCVSSAFAAGLAFTVGDINSANRYLTTGVAAATNTTLAAAGLLFKAPAETEVLVTIGTQAAGNVVGTLDTYLTGYIDN
jgi:hypothetical protein